mgnify:CR=1 FL=1
MKKIDLQKLFNQFDKLPQLSRTDPRAGCIARTQIIGSVLHDMGLKVGRAWILPVFENTSFFAPFYGQNGLPVRASAPQHGNFVRWRYHCAACLLDLPGQPVLDFPLFAGAVRAESWHRVYQRAQRDCKAPPGIELRLAIHDFVEIPRRQVLRYNARAQKQSSFIAARRLAQMATFAPAGSHDIMLHFRRHLGDVRLRRVHWS